MLTYHRTTEEEKYAITEWHYEGEYALYDNPPYEEQKKRGAGFANPRNNFYSFYDGAALVGFINLYEKEREVFFGIGVNPACCGRGYGQQMTRTACEISQSLFRANRCISRSEPGPPGRSGATKGPGSASTAHRFAKLPPSARARFTA